ncbi:MAG: hypothetical protein JW801_14215 [Bacteroidales bacterium]|nr:hypothetical protein [Bacteroidales bacterium]
MTKFSVPFYFGVHFFSGLRIWLGAGYDYEIWKSKDIPHESSQELLNSTNTDSFDHDILGYLLPGISMDFGDLNSGITYQIPIWNECYISSTPSYYLVQPALSLSISMQ